MFLSFADQFPVGGGSISDSEQANPTSLTFALYHPNPRMATAAYDAMHDRFTLCTVSLELVEGNPQE
jgi:hypothetical protein